MNLRKDHEEAKEVIRKYDMLSCFEKGKNLVRLTEDLIKLGVRVSCAVIDQLSIERTTSMIDLIREKAKSGNSDAKNVLERAEALKIKGV